MSNEELEERKGNGHQDNRAVLPVDTFGWVQEIDGRTHCVLHGLTWDSSPDSSHPGCFKCHVGQGQLNCMRPAGLPSSEIRITDPTTGGQKGQKLERFDLIPWDALSKVAEVYGIGAKKYAERNWEKGYAWSLCIGAMGRHMALWIMGQDVDKETGCDHMAHVAWHALALMTFGSRKLGTDDRVKVAA